MILNRSMSDLKLLSWEKLSGFQGSTAFCDTVKWNFASVPNRRFIMLECGARYPVDLALSANDQNLHE